MGLGSFSLLLLAKIFEAGLKLDRSAYFFPAPGDLTFNHTTSCLCQCDCGDDKRATPWYQLLTSFFLWSSGGGVPKQVMPSPPPRADAERALSQCLPGDRLVTWYEDDDLWHERLLIWPKDRQSWWVATPDGDMYLEPIVGDGTLGPLTFRIKGVDFTYWSRLTRPVYRFSESVSDEDFKGWIREALQELRGMEGPSPEVPRHVRNMKGDVVDATAYLGTILVPRRVGAKRLVTASPTSSPATSHEFPVLSSTDMWVIADPRGELQIGAELTPSPGDLFLGGKDAAFFRAGLWVRGELVDRALLDAWQLERLKHLTGKPLVDAAAERLGIRPDPEDPLKNRAGEARETPEVKDDDESDARTLWVEFDDQGDRFREWRKVVSDSAAHAWKDWPHQGPASLLHTMKHFHRHGGDPRSWLQAWLRKHHLAETDRTAHEVRSLVEALWLGGCYDQLNMPSLASFEAIGRRLQTIVEAYSNGANGVPDWGHARLFTGAVSADDVVSAELRSWAARRGKEEVELIAARSKIKDMRKLLTGAETTSSTLDDALPNPKGKQKGGRLRKPEVDTNEAVRALNWMAGAPQDRGAFSPSRLQQEALEHVKAACVASLELPEGATSPCSPEAAFRELLRGSSVYEAAGSTLASFSLDRVSLPESVHDCPQVTDLLYGTDAHQYLEDPERMLKPAEDHSDITPYWDPLLRKSVRHYKSLIQRLHKIGYCSYTLTPKERAGIFVVKKSDGVRQRLIIDGRRANFRFATPPSVRLCSPESFAKAEITWEDFDHTLFPGFEALPELHVGLSDIRDCFHRLKQPRWLQEFFCFDPVPAKWVGLSGQELGGTQLKPDDLVYPMPSSLPMGCSWSLYFAQTISEKLMGEVKGLEQSSLLRDRGPPLVIKVPRELLEGRSDPGPGAGKPRPEGDPRHYVYVDNLGVLSMDRSVVESSLSSITETFEQRGLKLHPGEVKSHKVDALGCRLSGRQCRASLKPARMWRLRQGIRHMLKMRCVSGRVLEVLIGHATYCSLLNRCLMPIFHATYKFIRKHYGERVTLWATVRREFEVFAALLPLCFSDWSRAWNGYISASDASLTGFGVCGRRIDPEIAAQVGRVPERERFRRCPSTSARASALSAALTENESDMDQEVEALLEAGWEVDASFVEVPRALLRKSDWEVNLYGKWAYPDDILVLEGHALVKSLQMELPAADRFKAITAALAALPATTETCALEHTLLCVVDEELQRLRAQMESRDVSSEAAETLAKELNQLDTQATARWATLQASQASPTP
ncbi:pksN [Symbiodinium natans]|uniref:PksN protein n=1 Tax=Symbiodinium natans TaxID=878477 RepID=A0A812LFS4_9DINO|nr:pksN [Symbiodinium natans]